jgi:methionyl-tRNA formyltransferase
MNPAPLRVIFLGTPEFAVPSLRAVRATSDVLAVVTQPDRPKGRGRQVSAPPVAALARADGPRVLQPQKLRDPQVVQTLAGLRPDVIVTVAYGKIIPPEILRIPPLGCINLHPSLLPKYRGAAPIQRAILDGETDTGVTIMYQSDELDAGDIILQQRVPIGPDDTAQTLEHRLAEVGAEALVEALRLIAAGRAPRRSQEHARATYVGKLSKDDGRIDWTRPASYIARQIRAMDPWPSAYTWHGGKLLKIWRGEVVPADREHPDSAQVPPGTVIAVRRGEGVVVATGDGALLLRDVQPEGRKRMRADDYARGARLEAGEQLGPPNNGSAETRERGNAISDTV